MHNSYVEIRSSANDMAIRLKNDWVFRNIVAIGSALDRIDDYDAHHVTFQCGGLRDIDIAGAWVLFRKSEDIKCEGRTTEFKGFRAAHFKYLESVTGATDKGGVYLAKSQASGVGKVRKVLESLGLSATRGIEDLGFISYAIFSGVKKPSVLALNETIRQVDQVGVRAIPLVMLVSFLMGLVMAYQGALQLEKFGATIFVVDLVAISILREMGVLLAAIMVAGRSGSAFAASLGVMNINQETDALRVMGLDPNQILLLPRILALLIALPFLTVLSDIAGLAGGMLLSIVVLDIGVVQFLERVASATDFQTFAVGFSKAPVFALLIGSVATLRGFQIKSSAEELGRLTTVAVVQSIFLVIVADGLFAVIFSRSGV